MLAKQLGWEVSVWDPRPANARDEFFHMADARLRCHADELGHWISEQSVNAAMIMTHSVPMDAQSLQAIHGRQLDYVGLLGPPHRRQDVLSEAGLVDTALASFINGPAGFDIGGELPESIALAVIAQCHSAILGPQSSHNG
jgi:xanthine dehydrogenase accessory factor